MPRSAPMASAVRIVSWAAAGPSAITTTSPAPAFSFRRSASSTANSSYGLRMNLTPASSSDLPSAAILTRVSESGTRLMQTAIFMWEFSVVSHQSSVQSQGQGASGSQLAVRRKTNAATVIWQPLAGWRLEICTQAHLHMPRRCGREPALHRRARRRGVLGEGAERVDAPVEQIPHRATQLEVAPGQRERQISDGIIGQATGDVLLVSAEPLPPDIARVHSGRQRQARLVPPVTKDRDREPRIDAVARHHRELVARRHRLTGGVARGGERSGRLEAGSRVAVVRVRPDTRRALPLERELHAATARRADILEVAAGDGRGDEEDVVPHVGAVHVGADVEVARRADVA